MKLLLPSTEEDKQVGPLSDLEAELLGEHSERARDAAVAKIDALEAGLRSQLERGVSNKDYQVLKAALDACQASREVLIMVARKAT